MLKKFSLNRPIQRYISRKLFVYKFRWLLYVLILLTGIHLVSCDQNKYSADYFRKFTTPGFPYNLGIPASRYVFPKDLVEISGLEYYTNGIIAGIEDEDGILYLYDTNSRQVVRKIKFDKHGDYESVAIVGNYAFVLSSKGDLYGFIIPDKKKADAKLFKTPFGSNNNLEGMCYYPGDSSLLIACKNDAGIHTELKGRAVYRYSLANGTVDETPFIYISNKVYKAKLDSVGLSKNDHYPFRPSGIAINPDNGYIYLISSVGKLLIVFDKNKNIVNMVPLPRSEFSQPEGICFSPDGDLFISSEGRSKEGYMIRFNKIKTK